MEIERVGVVGCGLMGSGIAEASARAGLDVLVVDLDQAALDRGRERIVQIPRPGPAGRQADRGRSGGGTGAASSSPPTSAPWPTASS